MSLRDEVPEVLPSVYTQVGQTCSLYATVVTCSTAVARNHDIRASFSVPALQADLAKRGDLVLWPGAFLGDALQCIKEEGLVVERKKGVKRADLNKRILFVRSFEKVDRNAGLIEKFLRDPKNSIVGSMRIYTGFDDCKSRKIYNSQPFKSNNRHAHFSGHSMMISGVGKQEDVCWFLELLNSHGKSFRDPGF